MTKFYLNFPEDKIQYIVLTEYDTRPKVKTKRDLNPKKTFIFTPQKILKSWFSHNSKGRKGFKKTRVGLVITWNNIEYFIHCYVTSTWNSTWYPKINIC